jgi:hypothetical protein
VHAEQQILCGFPGNAFVRDGHAVLEFGHVAAVFLIALEQIAFQHQPHNGVIAVDDLIDDIAPDVGLTLVFSCGLLSWEQSTTMASLRFFSMSLNRVSSMLIGS